MELIWLCQFQLVFEIVHLDNRQTNPLFFAAAVFVFMKACLLSGEQQPLQPQKHLQQ